MRRCNRAAYRAAQPPGVVTEVRVRSVGWYGMGTLTYQGASLGHLVKHNSAYEDGSATPTAVSGVDSRDESGTKLQQYSSNHTGKLQGAASKDAIGSNWQRSSKTMPLPR